MAITTSHSKNFLGMWNIRTLVFLIGILFLGTQISFLAINIFLYVEDPKLHVATFLDWFMDHGVQIPFCDENILLTPTINPSSSNQETLASSPLGTEDDNSVNSLSSSATSSSSNNNNRACIIRVSAIDISLHKVNFISHPLYYRCI